MKVLILFLTVITTPLLLHGQSSIVFDTGTTIDVGLDANVCAKTITVNGSYSGGGKFCSGPLPVELVSFNAIVLESRVELTWQTATEVNNYGLTLKGLRSKKRRLHPFMENGEKLVLLKAMEIVTLLKYIVFPITQYYSASIYTD